MKKNTNIKSAKKNFLPNVKMCKECLDFINGITIDCSYCLGFCKSINKTTN
jgi:hypothetical protein